MCSGQAVTKSTCLIEEYGASGYDNYLIGLTEAEQQPVLQNHAQKG
jgi:hypothetical protein